MKILITGGSGLLGQYLNIELSKNYTILTLYHENIRNCKDYNSTNINLTNTQELRKIFKSFHPEVVIHAAAVSNPMQAAQIDPGLVYNINVNVTKELSILCAENDTRLFYTSTDLVYAGNRGSMLKEDAKLFPASFYAESKLMGEVKIKEIFKNYMILRVALLYGYSLSNSYNHFHRMYVNLMNNMPVRVFTDQFRSPIEISNTAEIINQLIQADIIGETINIGGLERVSRFQLGEILCDIAGFDRNLLVPVTMDEMPDLPKVEDVSMDTGKLQSYNIRQKTIEDSIRELKNKFRQG
jgi:dTDP-4-dehydrorhamnose reductase